MPICERCGETYYKGSNFSTSDYCGTCIFINRQLPEPKVENCSAPKAPEGRWDSEEPSSV